MVGHAIGTVVRGPIEIVQVFIPPGIGLLVEAPEKVIDGGIIPFGHPLKEDAEVKIAPIQVEVESETVSGQHIADHAEVLGVVHGQSFFYGLVSVRIYMFGLAGYNS